MLDVSRAGGNLRKLRYAVSCKRGIVVDWISSRGREVGGLLQQQLTALSRVVYKSMNKSRTSEDRSNKATLLLTVLCSLLSRLQRIYRSQYFD